MKYKSNLPKLLVSLMAAALLQAGSAQAMDLVGEDIDLFLTNPAISAEVPNVLIMLDNTSNWSQQAQHWPAMVDATCTAAGITGNQQGDAEVCAIYKQVSTLTDSVNVGLMMYNDQNAGGYVRFPMKSMTSANRTSFQNTLKVISTNTPADKTSSNTAYENPLNDAFRYFNSLSTYGGSGAASGQADVTGYTSSGKTNFSFGAAASTSTCGYDYIIFIGNGYPNSNGSYASELNTAALLLNDAANVTPNTAAITNLASKADVWTRFMYNYGAKVGPGAYRHITTYTIDVCKDQCDSDQASLLTSMASVSNGRYFKATNLDAISTALSTIFAQVQAVNSVFAATTLPVSINVRGTNLNQVYIGVFRPDAQLSPRWQGNLKQYELGVSNSSTGQLQLIDGDGAQAINANTGFVANTARSFWTTTSTFWSFRSTFAATDVGKASDNPDGDMVEKGGAAQRIRVAYPNPDSTTAQTRNIYTCTGTCLTTSGSLLSGTLFNTSNADITSTLLGTYATVNVSSLTGSGTTATAGTSSAHGFSVGSQVTVAGATPTLFNGTFNVLTVPSTTSFTYSIGSNTLDTNHAYVTLNTLSSSGFNTATDFLTVSGATPAAYNVTDATASAVVGNTNQISYTMASSPVGAASGYTVSSKRLISNTANSTNLVWSSGPATNNVTVTRVNHGYSTGDSVTISGVNTSGGVAQTGLNGTFSVTKVDANSFKYSASATPTGGSVTSATGTFASGVPSGWGSGTVVNITGATESNYNATGVTITGVDSTAGTFSYTTSGAVAANATVPGSISRVIASDSTTWTVSAGGITGSGSGKKVRLTLSRVKFSGQALQGISVGDALTIANCTYNIGNSGGTNKTCSGLTVSAITPSTGSPTVTTTTTATAGNYANISGTVTVDLNPASGDNPSQLNSTTVVATAASATPASNATTITKTGSTTSSAVALSSIVRGVATVNAYGTVYATKTGDMTSLATSIANQSVATGTVTVGLAGSSDPNERQNLINWVRGLDNKDNENANNDSTDIRGSAHGDVLHSRPAVINYNRYGDDNDVFIFYGANDGMFHAIKGGRSSEGGNEQWAFVAQDHFGKLKRLRNQSPAISSVSPRDYFFDGPIGTYTYDATGNSKLGEVNDKVYIYVGMRRGGRYIYALDVSDPTAPKFLWRKGCPNTTGTTGCDEGYAEIGQTWSEPKLGYVRAFPGTLVMMFAAGYDSPVEDLQPCGISAWDTTSVTGKTGVVFPNVMTSANCPPSGGTTSTVNRTMGRGIYMVNALTGAVLWRAVSPNATAETVTGMTSVSVTGMDYAMPGDLAVLKARSNTGSRGTTGSESVPTGYLDRMYAVDTGGQVWRVDMADADAANWKVSKLAAVGSSSGTSASTMRKFMFSPDVVYTSDSNGAFDAVLLGSGDREHPFDQVASNRFYMFKDRTTGSMTAASAAPATITESSLFDVTNNCLQTASTCSSGQTQAQAAADLLAAKGWMLQLANTGEKTIATATTSAGTVIFNTNQPKQDSISGTAQNVGENAGNFCTSDLGTARQYGINYQTAVASNIYTTNVSSNGRFSTFAGGGFLPAPVPVVVQIGGKFYQTVISGVQATNPGGLTLQTRVRTYWYKKTN